MGKKAWLIFIVVCVVIVAVALVLMLILVPQTKASGVQTGVYEAVEKTEYTFDGSAVNKLNKQYTVTEQAVSSGKNTNKYEEGNINPFTPNSEVTIYNEPTLKNDKNNGSSVLTPDSK